MPQDTPEGSDADPSPGSRVSIIVTGWRAAPHLLSCLRSISAHPPSCPFDVVVSLNEPSEELTAALGREAPHVTVLSSPVNLGFAGACNRAAATAPGEFLMLLNDDAVAEPGWLDALLQAADDEPGAAAVGGRILAPDGRVQEDGAVLWRDGSVTLIDVYHRPSPAPPAGRRQVDYCSAASLLVRQSAWQEVGGLDEGYYPAYYEDVDLCLKLQAAGHKVLYEPASVIRHRHGASAPLPYRLFLIERNRRRLVARWPHVLAERPEPAPDDPRALGRAVTLAAGRPAARSGGPRLPDVRTTDGGAGEADATRREAEVLAAYAATLEARLAADAERRRRHLLARLSVAARETARRVPGARRLVVRLRLAMPGRRRRRPG